MATNTLASLRVKIDEESANAQRTDAEVLAWLMEDEQGPWVDVGGPDLASWAAAHKLPGYLYAAAQAVPATNASSAAHMIHTAWIKGESLQTSSEVVRQHLADAVPGVVSTTARDAILLLARPNVARWRNTDWTQAPILGDVVAARNLA